MDVVGVFAKRSGVKIDAECASVCKGIMEACHLRPEELFFKWEAWVMRERKGEAGVSAVELKSFAKVLEATEKVRSNTGPGARVYAVKTQLPRVVGGDINDFFTYIDDFDGAPQPVVHMDVEVPKNEPLFEDKPEEKYAGGVCDGPKVVGDDVVDDAYAARTGSGKTVADLNWRAGDDGTPRETAEGAVQVQVVDRFLSQDNSSRFMNDAVPGRIETVREHVRDLGAKILDRVKESRREGEQLPNLSPQSFHTPSPDVVLAVGRIRVELEEVEGAGRHINQHSVILESEDGYMVKLNLDRIQTARQQLFLNPGMVVVVEGVNTNGRLMDVHAVYDNAMPLPSKFQTSEAIPERDSGPLPTARVLVAAGPYSTSANLKYEPLDDLVEIIARDRPDVVVLMGPFLDTNHPLVNASTPVPFDSLFETRVIARIRRAAAKMDDAARVPHIVIVPSLDDVHHDFVCPQPAFRPDLSTLPQRNLTFASNPSVLTLSSDTGLHSATLAVSSLPSLQDISADCICWNKPDRFSAIMSHMVRQCSFYPSFPASAAVPLDSTLAERLVLPSLKNAETVDVVVVPSKLNAFAKPIDGGAIAVNPGLLCKGSSGGTYAEIVVPLHASGAPRPLNANSDLLRANILRL